MYTSRTDMKIALFLTVSHCNKIQRVFQKELVFLYLPLDYILHFHTMFPSVQIRPLNILSASPVNLQGITNSIIFHNNLRIRLFPLQSPIHRKYSNPFKRCGMYPSISKCNAKRCKCCKHLSTKSTITSSVNSGQFSGINNSELD